MSYNITCEQISTISDLDLAFGTTKFLPNYRTDVPEEFKGVSNIYCRLVESWFFGSESPKGNVSFNDGFQYDGAVKDMQRVVRAHLKSREPKHEHKISGVGYMLSKIVTITPDVAADA